MKVYYLPKDLTTPNPIYCENIFNFYQYLNDTVIYDRSILINLDKGINSLNNDSNQDRNLDIRIKCYLIRNSKIDTLCMGSYYGISYNGRVKDDSEILKDIIWDIIGYNYMIKN